MDWITWLIWIIKAFILIMALLTGFAYLTLYERRALARIQVRIGPNRAGPQGLLQPIADAVKLIFKEELTPAKADKIIFFLAPIITMVPSLIIAAVIPWGRTVTMFGRDDYPLPGEHQRGRAVPDGDRLDRGVRHRAGGLVLQ